MSSPFIDREGVHDKLMLLGTVAGLMADHSEAFGNGDLYALQGLLYNIAHEVFPEWNQEEAPQPDT